MGQQQLLLLVIGIVVVAVAVMTGIYAFRQQSIRDEGDGLLDRSISIASYAVQWKVTNDPFVGGNQSYEQLATGGLDLISMSGTTLRGEFAITDATDNTLEVTAVSTRYPNVGVRVFVEGYDIDSSSVRTDGSITLP